MKGTSKQNLQELMNQLGRPTHVFRLSRIKQIVFVACGMVMCVMGVFFLAAGRIPDLAKQLFGFADALAVGLLALGAVVLTQTWRTRNQVVYICPKGLIRVRGAKCQSCRWDQIAEIEEVQGSYKRIKNHTCHIVMADGSRIGLVSDAFPDFDRLIGLLKNEAENRSISWMLNGLTKTPDRPEKTDQLPEEAELSKVGPKLGCLPYVGVLCIIVGGALPFIVVKHEKLFSSGDRFFIILTGMFSLALGIYLVTFWFRRN
jgi:hypothetical protein